MARSTVVVRRDFLLEIKNGLLNHNKNVLSNERTFFVCFLFVTVYAIKVLWVLKKKKHIKGEVRVWFMSFTLELTE